MQNARGEIQAMRRTGIALTTIGLLAAIGVFGFVWLAATHGGLDYKCIVEGPRRESAPFAVVSEAVQVHGYFSSWPLGRACDWERADGKGFVTASPGWAGTIDFLSCLAIAAVGVVLRNLGSQRRSGRIVK